MRPRSLCTVAFGAVLVGIVAPSQAGDLNPPAGPISSTLKPLAEVEPRTAINADNTPGNASASFVIDQPGSYYLAGNINADASKDAIHISTSNVTIDLNGFTLDGTGATGASSAIEITDSYTGITIYAGNIIEWLEWGIHGEDATEIDVRDIRFSALGGYGILVGEAQSRDCMFFQCDGAFGASSDSLLERALIVDCTGTAVSLGSRGVVRHCTIRNSGTFAIRLSGQDGLIEHNHIADTPNIGINVATGAGTVVRDNSVLNGAVGLLIGSAGNSISGNIVEANIVNYNFVQGNDLELILTEIPQAIDWPARVTLIGDLVGSNAQDGITINSDDVTIDLNGHALVGVPGSLDGISTPGSPSGLAIRNGVVRNWGVRGIDLSGSTGCQLSDLRMINNNESGLVTGSDATVSRCIARSNGVFGFIIGNDASVSDCTAASNGAQGIDTSQGCTVHNCAAYLNGQQGIQVGNGSTVSSCSTFDNSLNGIVTSLSCTVVDCTSRGNTIYGVSASDGSTVARCTLSQNGSGGIRVSLGSTIRNNTCFDHATGPGIDILSNGARIDSNHCYQNSVGIKCTGAGSFITRNTCAANTTNWDIAAGNVCLVVAATPTGAGFSGNAGGTAPGSTDPNTNFSH